MIEKSETEKNKDKKKIYQKISNLEANFEPSKKDEQFLEFLRKFIICEQIFQSACKLKIGHKISSKEYTDLKVNSIVSVLNYYGYTIEKSLIKFIFSSDDKKGERSCKKLRNYICHDYNQFAINELFERYDECISHMDTFINQMKEQSTET